MKSNVTTIITTNTKRNSFPNKAGSFLGEGRQWVPTTLHLFDPAF